MNKIKILIFTFGLLFQAYLAVSQDTINVKGKVLSIDTMRFYMVIKIKTCDSIGSSKVILSKRESNLEIIGKNQEIIVGNIYLFKLLGISIFKADDGHNIILNLRRYSYSNKFSLEFGEFPYLAINMSGTKIY